MLYPDKETAAEAAAHQNEAATYAHRDDAVAAAAAAYWSKRFGKPVSYTEKNIPLLVLNREKDYIEVLAGDRKAWIIFSDWLNLKEIK